MQLGYSCETNKDFNAAVTALQERTAAKGFRVLHVHDLQATMAEKGLERSPFKIIEICNSKFAHKILGINEDIGLFMPCKINVYTKNGKTIISAMRPSMISEFFDNKELKEVADEVDAIVRSIVDDVK
ncbi:MAG TPA: hypothetical protein DEO84_02495 [candidate division Zixibacteria bacterium]|jgi:uncharacterized protein (DUF302 family)|nr:hypothetical protein [candidate division Zixibacteria bacterium]HBZ00167.1 hypothetical protein [candidate division Zixibacteria bacterium]